MKTKLDLVLLDERAMPSATYVNYSAPAVVEATLELNQRFNPADVLRAIRSVLGRDDEVASIIAAFDEGNGDIIIGPIQGGGPGIFYPAGQDDVPRATIVVDPYAPGNGNNLYITIGTTLFEMLRATHAHEQQALDQAVKSGRMTPEQYATESERLAYKYCRQHHDIIKRMIGAGQLPKDAYIFSGIENQTEDGYIDAQKKSGHWQAVRNSGSAIAGGQVNVN